MSGLFALACDHQIHSDGLFDVAMLRACEIRKRVGTESQPTRPQSEWLNALSTDQTLSDPVRQRALQFAREWK